VFDGEFDTDLDPKRLDGLVSAVVRAKNT